jgi:hypothetical protein
MRLKVKFCCAKSPPLELGITCSVRCHLYCSLQPSLHVRRVSALALRFQSIILIFGQRIIRWASLVHYCIVQKIRSDPIRDVVVCRQTLLYRIPYNAEFPPFKVKFRP